MSAYTLADLERAKAFIEANSDGWHCPPDPSIAQLIADVRAEERERCAAKLGELVVMARELVNAADRVPGPDQCIGELDYQTLLSARDSVHTLLVRELEES